MHACMCRSLSPTLLPLCHGHLTINIITAPNHDSAASLHDLGVAHVAVHTKNALFARRMKGNLRPTSSGRSIRPGPRATAATCRFRGCWLLPPPLQALYCGDSDLSLGPGSPRYSLYHLVQVELLPRVGYLPPLRKICLDQVRIRTGSRERQHTDLPTHP